MLVLSILLCKLGECHVHRFEITKDQCSLLLERIHFCFRKPQLTLVLECHVLNDLDVNLACKCNSWPGTWAVLSRSGCWRGKSTNSSIVYVVFEDYGIQLITMQWMMNVFISWTWCTICHMTTHLYITTSSHSRRHSSISLPYIHTYIITQVNSCRLAGLASFTDSQRRTQGCGGSIPPGPRMRR